MHAFLKVDMIFHIMMQGVAFVNLILTGLFHGSDNHLQMYAQICVQGKKKSPFKRITGLQVGEHFLMLHCIKFVNVFVLKTLSNYVSNFS